MLPHPGLECVFKLNCLADFDLSFDNTFGHNYDRSDSNSQVLQNVWYSKIISKKNALFWIGSLGSFFGTPVLWVNFANFQFSDAQCFPIFDTE